MTRRLTKPRSPKAATTAAPTGDGASATYDQLQHLAGLVLAGHIKALEADSSSASARREASQFLLAAGFQLKDLSKKPKVAPLVLPADDLPSFPADEYDTVAD